jgi:hypothetical protein
VLTQKFRWLGGVNSVIAHQLTQIAKNRQNKPSCFLHKFIIFGFGSINICLLYRTGPFRHVEAMIVKEFPGARDHRHASPGIKFDCLIIVLNHFVIRAGREIR